MEDSTLWSFVTEAATEITYTALNDTAWNVTESELQTTTPSHDRKLVRKTYPLIAAEMVVSCICLIISIKVYSRLPEFRNVHGKNLSSMSACLLVTYLMLFLDLIVRKYISFGFCFTIAIIIHVSFLANFFWTNVMAYDIWRSLTNMENKGEVRTRTSRRYFKYSLYSWSATVLTTLPAAVMEWVDGVPKQYRPQFGVKRCWLNSKTPFLLYFNLPVGLILFANMVMFVLTLRKLWLIKKMTAILNVKQQEKRLHLYLKLFLVMGITWSSEFLPWLTGQHWMYAIAAMITALHGFFLFLIFVCKRKILRRCYQIFYLGKEPPSSASYTTSSTNPSSNPKNTSF